VLLERESLSESNEPRSSSFRFVSPQNIPLASFSISFADPLSISFASLTRSITCIRWKEIRDGITVFRLNDVVRPGGAVVQEKEELGKSSVAGAKAVAQSAASRVFTNM